jgi:hypothetical protein
VEVKKISINAQLTAQRLRYGEAYPQGILDDVESNRLAAASLLSQSWLYILRSRVLLIVSLDVFLMSRRLLVANTVGNLRG